MKIIATIFILFLAGCVQMLQPTVISFGDSVSLGYAAYARHDLCGVIDYRHDSWANGNIDVCSRFNNTLVSEVVNAGENDGCSLTEYTRMQSELSGESYNVIVFNAGLHDMQTYLSPHGCGNVSMSEYRNNIEKLSALAEQHANIVIWVNTTPIPYGYPNEIYNNQVIYNQVADGVVREHHFWILETDAEGQKPNDIHFTTEGYSILGAKVAACILNSMSDVETSICHR